MDEGNLYIFISIIQIFYGTVLTFFYIFLWITLFHLRNNHPFNGSYYRFVRIAAVTDLIFYLTYCICFKWPSFPFFSQFFASIPPGFWMYIVHFLYLYTKFQRLGYLVVLTMNRASAILIPTKYKMFWKTIFWTIIGIILVYPLSFSWTVWLAKLNYSTSFLAPNVMVTGMHWKPEIDLTIYQFVLTFIIITMCALLHICCAIIIYCYKPSNSSLVLNRAGRALLFVCAGEFFAEILDAGYHVFLAIIFQHTGMNTFFQILFYHTCWFIDLSVFSRPCLLFLMSKPLRKAIYQCFTNINKISQILKMIPTSFPSKTEFVLKLY